jgi:acetylornithine deacetylase/succinyl-diaminopimelate desuccinylase-like protein
VSWLVREGEDLRCDFALNEGGGWALKLADGRLAVVIEVGEKQVSSARLRVFGRAGHASVPAASASRARDVDSRAPERERSQSSFVR